MSLSKASVSRRKVLKRLGVFTSLLLSPVRLLTQPLQQKLEAFKKKFSGNVISKGDSNYEVFLPSANNLEPILNTSVSKPSACDCW
jgi:hypothetical protein